MSFFDKIAEKHGSILGLKRDAAVKLVNADGDLYEGLEVPRSAYDKVKKPPFSWSQPAKNQKGEYPAPWRVANLESVIKFVGDRKNFWVDTISGSDPLEIEVHHRRGPQSDPEVQEAMVVELASKMAKAGYFVRTPKHIGKTYIIISDDIEISPLSGMYLFEGSR